MIRPARPRSWIENREHPGIADGQRIDLIAPLGIRTKSLREQTHRRNRMPERFHLDGLPVGRRSHGKKPGQQGKKDSGFTMKKE